MWKSAVEKPANLASSRPTERLQLMEAVEPPPPTPSGGVRLPVIIAAIWAIVVVVAQVWGVFEAWEQPVTNLKQAFGWSSHYPLENDVALIAIEEIPTDRPWPWPHL